MMFVSGCRRVPRPPARITAVLTALTLPAMLAVSEEQLVPLVLRRTTSLFATDVEASRRDLAAAIRGARLLVSGAAGSIGSAFVKEVSRFGPASLTLIDLDENGLVELVRDLRSAADPISGELRTLAIGVGSLEFERYVGEAPA